MLLHMLSDKDKKSFLEIATLVCLSDNPLHWEGKSLEELTGDVALNTAAFREIETEKSIINGFFRECGEGASGFENIFNRIYGASPRGIEKQLLEKLMALPLARINAPEERQAAACAVLEKLLDHAGFDSGMPSVSKAILYELMLLALADGEISTVESALLKHFAEQQKLDQDDYDDLLERAEAMNREAVKTLSLVLE